MTQKIINNIASSVKQRLLDKRTHSRRTFDELVQYYAIERFLYRFSKSAFKDQFVLKGAIMLYAWGVGESRPTMDIDMLGHIKNDQELIKDIFKEICQVQVENDGLVFDLENISSEEITSDADYKGVRILFFCFLEKTRIRMQVDIGFGDAIFPKPEHVVLPSILDFSSPELNGYTIESSIAEKFQAMLQLGEINSRMKDFYDVWLFSQKFEYKFEVLLKAINITLNTRDYPMPKPDDIIVFKEDFAQLKQKQWIIFVKRINGHTVPENFTDIINAIKLFLYPVANAIYNNTSEITGKWSNGGDWIFDR